MCGPGKCPGCDLSGGIHSYRCPVWLEYTAKLQKEKENHQEKQKHLSSITILNQHVRIK